MILTNDRCYSGNTSIYHHWVPIAQRVTWVDINTTGVPPSAAPVEIVYRCAYCGAERAQRTLSTRSSP